MQRASASSPQMGLTTWEKAPSGKILKSDVVVPKNYLKEDELAALARVVGMYLDCAEDMAKRKIPMSMADWAVRLDAFLQFNQRDVLEDFGKVSMEVAKSCEPSQINGHTTPLKFGDAGAQIRLA